MWKHTCQCLILLALASLPCAHPTQAAMMVKDAEEQIHLITDARDIWDLSEPGMDTVGYMCGDLDGNGRLEILVSESGGTGLHTYTKIYEVNEAKDALVPCGRSWSDTSSEADVMMTNYVPMSVNGIDGIQCTPSQMNTVTGQNMGRRISLSPCRTGRSMRKPSPRHTPSTMTPVVRMYPTKMQLALPFPKKPITRHWRTFSPIRKPPSSPSHGSSITGTPFTNGKRKARPTSIPCSSTPI